MSMMASRKIFLLFPYTGRMKQHFIHILDFLPSYAGRRGWMFFSQDDDSQSVSDLFLHCDNLVGIARSAMLIRERSLFADSYEATHSLRLRRSERKKLAG